MALAETIGDEICRDRPIYVRVACSGKYKPDNLWYVIEEKPWNDEALFIASDEEGNNDGTEGLLCWSDSDYIRRISVPDSDLQDTSLAVLGSRIYLIGGDIDTAMKNEDKENIGYKHFELGQNPEWVLGGGKLLSAQFGAAAVGRDGFIYSVGYNQYRLSPDTGILKQLPQFPVPAFLIRRERNYAPYQSHLLALTKSKLFIYVTVSLNAPNLMLSYDLGTGEWDEGYDDISGKWSAGVVLYDDRYLFAFGTQNPMSLPATMSMKPVQKVVPGIYVFDIQQRKWLPEPVKGLPTDGITLPEVYETHDYENEADMDMYVAGPGYTPYLFQVGKENDHKLALLWESKRPNPGSRLPQCLLYWSKFVLSPITIGTATVDPHFYVSSLSNGHAVLDEGTHLLLNCAAGMVKESGEIKLVIHPGN
uniref:uncharacterized protein LOC105349332 n=1 Tax=Fragaria vesca subsp. vesca TaxID=101020 RepID=UPI0005C84B6C|nr:PREDICTED: uncharacterized protein LOC105349332 [Fragaria vesca subsp. vesca]